MSNIHHLHHAAQGGAEFVKNLAPLPEPKNPVVAFMAGLVFGALGVALYFKSAKDFFICFGLFVAASILLPGLGLVLGWGFAPVYGAYRAHSSNEQLGL